MGSIKVRNPLLSKKLKRTETRLLIIDDNQIRFNQICEQLTANEHRVQAYLLDDIKNFEKQLHLTWDLVIFGRAYDLKVDQALTLIRASQQPNLPLLLLLSLLKSWSSWRKTAQSTVATASLARTHLPLLRVSNISSRWPHLS